MLEEIHRTIRIDRASRRQDEISDADLPHRIVNLCPEFFQRPLIGVGFQDNP